MGQLGFFDADKRLQALSARSDPLEAIDHLVPWESFRVNRQCELPVARIAERANIGRAKARAAIRLAESWSHYHRGNARPQAGVR